MLTVGAKGPTRMRTGDWRFQVGYMYLILCWLLLVALQRTILVLVCGEDQAGADRLRRRSAAAAVLLMEAAVV